MSSRRRNKYLWNLPHLLFYTGLDTQIQEIKESVELLLTHPELYEEMGIKPPKGVILYGAPGTGKTLLAKGVANQTSAIFLRVVGSELIQKYLVSWSKDHFGLREQRSLITLAKCLSKVEIFLTFNESSLKF